MIPNASQILPREVMEGSIFLRYHEEIVDCVSPDSSASWYSDQLRSRRNCVILSNMSIIGYHLQK